MATQLTLHHCPQSRSTGVLALLRELDAPFELHLMNMKRGENRAPAYLAINPLGKVPAITHDGAVITEQVAIYQYLAELFPAAGLAPALGDPSRGPYLRWLALYGSCFEPAVIDHWMQRPPTDKMACPYGDFDSIFTLFTDQLAKGPYLLGDKFSAVDVLWGTSIGWMNAFKLLPESSLIAAYAERIASRPAVMAANAEDAELAAAQAQAA
ncbi:glutathione S-transferase family protein [Pseudoduganella namucuonensis]|uniref:Glutathione S-transferase n=1 Tax=Pseudoduganella namucuonensis TaxID=1035707 RepID=A0A1I7LBZ5_9BURK|nr:glutathione S-transferase [Pseudoduganella namucuonensis]SFV07200.1 glutathione S-transferase [Pseudoduganella namucuonensis]